MTGRADVMKILAKRKESPQEIAESLKAFSEAARVLSSNDPSLIDLYPDKWIAVSHDGVRASADTLDDLLAQVDKKLIPRSEVIVRLIEREPRTLIL